MPCYSSQEACCVYCMFNFNNLFVRICKYVSYPLAGITSFYYDSIHKQSNPFQNNCLYFFTSLFPFCFCTKNGYCFFIH